MAFRAVCFDGYGTLFEDAISRLMGFCAQIVREQKLGMAPEAFYALWDRAFWPLIQADDFITLREAYRVSLHRVFRDLNVNGDPVRYVDAIFNWFCRARVYADVRPALAGLDGVTAGVISNADADNLQAALKHNRLRFPVVVSSESARCYKPGPAIFQAALRAIGCRPEAALYVGDSQEDDIVGARRAGMRVAWLNRQRRSLRPEIPQPDYEITSLLEIPEILKTAVD